MKQNPSHSSDQQTTFAKLLGQPGGPRDEPPACADKMGVEDGYIYCEVGVYTKYRLVYQFKRGGLYEKFFSRKDYHRAGRQFEHYLGILREVMAEQFVASLERVFGWILKRGRTRQTQLIFLLPDSSLVNGPVSDAGRPTKNQPEDYSI